MSSPETTIRLPGRRCGKTSAAKAHNDAIFLAICRNERQPYPYFYALGRDAHAAEIPFHECPQPFDTPEALSWRIGWNDAALEALRVVK
jgi:hypothetical protein